MSDVNLQDRQRATIRLPLTSLSVAVSSALLVACSSTPTTTQKAPTRTIQSSSQPALSAQDNPALLDMDSLDELEGLLEATDMTMVENNALLVQRYGNLWDRMRVNFKMNSNVYDPRIEAQKSWFISRQDYLNRLTARASRYLYHTVREAERRNIPTELALLPVIESSYDPNATSNAAAAGLWQFIPSTGRIYGLNQTSTFDGRRDVIESTRAAYDFLTTLYNQFGSWELALAAYNAGPGRVQSAINYNEARGLPTDYWSLKLPTETMNYVPRFMAVAQIVKNPSTYNVYLPAIANRQHFRSVPANVGVSLYEVSGLTGVSYDELRALNGGLTAGTVDMSGPSRLLIPNDVNETIDKKIGQLKGDGYRSSMYTATNTNTPVATTTNPALTAIQKAINQKQNTTLPNNSAELANMASSMVKNQTTTYVAPVVTATNSTEPPLSPAEQRQVTAQVNAEMQSANTLPTTSVVVTSNKTIVQEPPLSQAERDLIAKQIEQTSPQVQQAINPADGNIKLDAIQTQQSVLAAKGETKKLTYEDAPATPKNTKAPTTASVDKPVVKKPRPAGVRTTYQVKRGDTLASISSRMGVNWRDVAEWNQINPSSPLLAGSVLYLYNAKPVEPIKPVEKTKHPDSYTVQSGDTLSSIADKFDLSISELAKYNNLSTDYQVKAKQTLWLIPDKVSYLKPKTTNYRKYQGATSKYTVQAGDTLTLIATKLGVSVDDIADLNDLDEVHRIQRGQIITVPATPNKVSYALNGKDVIHVVKSGESLNSIANTYGITIAELAKANYLKPTAGVKANEKLTIPQAGSVAKTSTNTKVDTKTDNKSTNKADNKTDTKSTKEDKPVSKYRGATESYEVKAGESLNSLAGKYGITGNELAGINNLKAGASLQRGQSIKVPKLTTTYKVKSGDTVISLASRYGITTKEFASLNNMTGSTQLKIGQTVTVPMR
ncbi:MULTISPECIES: LysM peptidoglycan-binding domain-containing protein [unclassified Moraxella]|uniref:LysM peptidoglycan-binding domain-containing protein n=1 Tax=unclassified Moraxella TaxID=2685852 RepID=UPI003AF98EA1